MCGNPGPGWRNRSDAEVLKTSVPYGTCGFDSHPGHNEDQWKVIESLSWRHTGALSSL